MQKEFVEFKSKWNFTNGLCILTLGKIHIQFPVEEICYMNLEHKAAQFLKGRNGGILGGRALQCEGFSHSQCIR